MNLTVNQAFLQYNEVILGEGRKEGRKDGRKEGRMDGWMLH